MDLYRYEGPVEEFGRCVDQCWRAETYAASEQKARSNLTYRWKRDHGRANNIKITLPGKITKEE